MDRDFQIDSKLASEVRNYGNFDIKGCYACGSCTVICPLTGNSASFPRRCIRYVQLGLKEALKESLEPWLCYYCGDCSESCPRETEPGEAMMTLRRYLTAQYDWTGLSAKFYKSKLWEYMAIFLLSALVVVLAILFHGPIVTERVELNTFAPVELVHTFDMILLVTLSFFLLSNVFRMWWFTIVRNHVKVPLYLYITEVKTLIQHFVTQIQFRECSTKLRWIKHWLLTAGYVLMFTMIIVFLDWFQTDNIYPIYHPQRWLGYFATFVLVFFTVEILLSRFKKKEQIHRFSHHSDWIFPILLLLTALSGIAVHIFRYVGLPLATYYTYVLHLAIACPMLIVEVPFGKWSHLAYRPLAIYFHTIKQKAEQLQTHKEGDLQLVGSTE
ncbi:MAG: 4Fe-4S ferredoxin [Candidatus Aminicenantes bacterium]|nr:4Fe-4S ferredoxin [Candidatus Aminicenantes bacterium]NIM80680.1 4Fe-4S ferredoxin [Candidatus Aminicenantes bacterium]NIN20057.1 4Fe-4S ferredoxin [Candidatus Aminicenantes bacterium]NIN43844.1 4Fe-4S ferredoxin [Candidatus Aminicenantes bacterium]NIN86655.1 4Fe-4S ferredoxin [Candidatus Aminicenantes bacterium]